MLLLPHHQMRWVKAVSNSSPPDVYRAYQDLLKRVVTVLDIQVEQICEKSHKLVDMFAFGGLAMVALS